MSKSKFKFSEIIYEPFNIVRLLINAFKLTLTLFKVNKDELIEDEAINIDFKNIKKELLSESGKLKWRNYIIFSMSILGFFLVLILISIISGDIISLIESIFMFILTLVMSGYKPMILQKQKLLSFREYLKLLPQNISALYLWNFYKVEKIWLQ